MILSASSENIARAADIVRLGGVVAFPTETVYGLGADATCAQAVKQIFKLKGRPAFNPLIVHIAEPSQLADVADLQVDKRAAQRASILSRFWPGPLSMVLPKGERICSEVTAGLPTVAVRLPAHPVATELIKAAGAPIAAPSANLFSAVSPTMALHVEDSFAQYGVPVLDGGSCQVGLESTIVSLVHEQVLILRPGGVTLEQIKAAFSGQEEVQMYKANRPEPQVLAPGMLKVHYAPSTPLVFKQDIDPSGYPPRTAIVSFRQEAKDPAAAAAVKCLSPEGDLNQVAARLFAALRELDSQEFDLIVVDTCPEEGIGLAIMDRLRRAARHFSA